MSSESSFEEEPRQESAPKESYLAAKADLYDTENPTTSGGSDSSTSGDDKIVSRQENQAVNRSKYVVLIIITLTAAAFATATYLFTSREEEDDFKTQFRDYATGIESVIHDQASNVFGVLESMAITVSSFEEEQASREWPFVLMPHFEERGKQNNKLSKAIQLTLVPLVDSANATAWESFAKDNQGWVQEGVDVSPELHAGFIGHHHSGHGGHSDYGGHSGHGGGDMDDTMNHGDGMHGGNNMMNHSNMEGMDDSGMGGMDDSGMGGMDDSGMGMGHMHQRRRAATNDNMMTMDMNTMDEDENKYIVPPIPEKVFRFSEGEDGEAVIQDQPGLGGKYGPVWQQAPAPHDPEVVNYDVLSHPTVANVYEKMVKEGLPVISPVFDLFFLYGSAVHDEFVNPHSIIMAPIVAALRGEEMNNNIVGFLIAVISWDNFLVNLLADSTGDIHVVLRNTCQSGEDLTYLLRGPQAIFMGEGDMHETQFNSMKVETQFAPFLEYDTAVGEGDFCAYTLDIYPTSDFENNYRTVRPVIYAVVVALVFFLTAAVFLGYDYLVQRRQRRTLAKAQQTSHIVSALFPKQVRDRLLKDAEDRAEQEMALTKKTTFGKYQKQQLKSFLDQEGGLGSVSQPFGTKPIADLFPQATVMFADIVGFTAWSSVREPTQVFVLLESVYHAFDEIARRRRVFKVETIGDCYVAVCGLPEPRSDNAIVMARFARECLVKFSETVKQLEVTLGPDTGDLGVRIGLHTGPVTAGVLRGEKSRFQLFGDTVNTASRIESSGDTNRVHVSLETAEILMASNKAHWVAVREDQVVAKGKGALKTYWLNLKPNQSLVSTDESSNKTGTSTRDVKFEDAGLKPKRNTTINSKLERLVGWNTDVFARLIKKLVVHREAQIALGVVSRSDCRKLELPQKESNKTVLDEVKEIIELPEFDVNVARSEQSPDTVELDDAVMDQLRRYILLIAGMYRQNPFHNFEHASHVTMSVVKLMPRINQGDELEAEKADAHDLHKFTYGITSDPLTQFAVIFSALIHDVDHTGVPNTQLVKEQTHLASVYRNQSVAEQNSVDLAWDLFMDTDFNDLRNTICQTSEELQRFREIVVNSVMATDIMDKDLKALRNGRWETAFSDSTDDSESEAVNRKATIVIEHLIQASDVAHTMQHWHVYRKWNEQLFKEMYKAFKDGRADKDPAEFWYKGELGFFDFYIIPLAKKLDDCGVFGVSSDEYLNYAQQNRREWEANGQAVVEGMIQNALLEGDKDCIAEESKADLTREDSYKRLVHA